MQKETLIEQKGNHKDKHYISESNMEKRWQTKLLYASKKPESKLIARL